MTRCVCGTRLSPGGGGGGGGGPGAARGVIQVARGNTCGEIRGIMSAPAMNSACPVNPIAVVQTRFVLGPYESVAVSNMVCSFLGTARTHYSSGQEDREVSLSCECVGLLALPSTST